MEKYLVRVLNDKEADKVVGGNDAKSVATNVGVGVTCASSVLAVGFFIGAMASEDHKEVLYKTAAAFGSVAVAGAISTGAISKIK